MIWLFPRQEHVLIDCSADFSMWVLVFRQKLVARETGRAERRVLRSRDPGSIFCRKITAHQAGALEEVYQNAASHEDDLEFRNAALGYALAASWQAYQSAPESAPLSDVHPAVARAARLLSEAEESISLEQLARQSGLSAARLSRLFKLQTGVSVTGFRQRQCLERFLRLYGNGAKYSVIDAALEAGFGSYPQFHRVFSGAMGMNPAAYRRKMAGQMIGEAR
jgi:AraC-like DNA-binding protein